MHTHVYTHTSTFVAVTYIITIYTDSLYSKQLNSFICPITSLSIILPVLIRAHFLQIPRVFFCNS